MMEEDGVNEDHLRSFIFGGNYKYDNFDDGPAHFFIDQTLKGTVLLPYSNLGSKNNSSGNDDKSGHVPTGGMGSVHADYHNFNMPTMKVGYN